MSTGQHTTRRVSIACALPLAALLAAGWMGVRVPEPPPASPERAVLDVVLASIDVGARPPRPCRRRAARDMLSPPPPEGTT